MASTQGSRADARQSWERTVQQGAATATAVAEEWQAMVSATTQAHKAVVSARARAQPTPAPTQVLSRARGRVVNISAAESDGQFVVTLEVVP